MKKQKISWKGMSILLGIVAVLAAAVFPHYMWTLERAKAGAAEAALIQVAIAENLYFIHHKSYTNDWRKLEEYLSKNDELQGIFAPLPEPGEERFFAFSAAGLEAGNDGFSIGIELNEQESGGKVYAVRSGGMFSYMLTDGFPKSQFVCEAEGWKNKWLCNKFTVYIEAFMLRQQADQSAEGEQPAEKEQK